jgi:predicted membrane channel-forming protein YqfA (hemolysin III family)
MVLARRPQLLPSVAAGGLLLGALGQHPYGYYTLLRWAVTIAAIVVAWTAWHSNAQLVTWLYVGIAVLFNPISPIYLDRATWRPIDVATAACFLGALALQRKPLPELGSSGS